MSESEKQHQIMHTLGMANMDDATKLAATLSTELRGFLETVKDHGTSIDSGMGMGSADLWVTVGGREFFITMRASNRQIALDEAASKDSPND